MNLSKLSKIRTKERRRLGQGHGSGRVKTAGRGTKGQKARGDIKLSFEGGALPLIKRMPFLRGKGRNKAYGKPMTVTLDQISRLPAKAVVTLEALVAGGVVGKKDAMYGVKLVGSGTIKDAYTIAIATSKGALSKIEKAGGKLQESSKK